MAFLQGFSLLISAIVIIAVPFFIPKHNNVRAIRVGGDPGLFGLKTLVAKFKFLVHGHAYVTRRYEEAKDEPYHLQTTNVDRLVLPPKYYSELCTLNTKVLSHSVATSQATIGEYSGVSIVEKDRQSVDVCKGGLTKSLPTIIPEIARTIQQWLHEELGDCDNIAFFPRTGLEFASSLNSKITSFIFVGPSLTNNKEWLKAFLDIQPKVAAVIIWLTPMPQVLRSLVGRFLPAVQALEIHKQKIRGLLFSPEGRSEAQKFPTILDHYIATSKTGDEQDITAKFCILSTSAIHTVTNALTQALFELCLHPEVIEDLRKELKDVLQYNEGEWSLDVVKQLKRMDSFLKESQRCNPHSYLTFNRVVLSDVHLSDGLRLPKGQFISFPGGPMAMDKEYHVSPERFDPLRFLKVGVETSRGTSEHELAGIEHGNLHWGGGMSTCPGRWYASAALKLMVGLIILGYDIKFPDGQVSKLPNAYLDTMVQPNKKQEILFRKRT
ncbi:cytochrome P450 [Phaeosphaeria sp. MPI-PUGE-AT-0046c]|nr:cytochrome P450 [Phaeosphaeria sp. MPI-PUGE-AT-0046c]